MKRSVILSALVVLLAALGVACAGGASGGGGGGSGAQEVKVTLTEFKVEAAQTTFVKGQRYRFVVNNAGTLEHEFSIAPRGEKEMSKMLLHVSEKDLQPKTTKNVDFTFNSAGNFEFACHVPGHYEGGMVTPITVN